MPCSAATDIETVAVKKPEASHCGKGDEEQVSTPSANTDIFADMLAELTDEVLEQKLWKLDTTLYINVAMNQLIIKEQ